MEVSSSTSPILFLDCVNYSHRDPDRHDTTYPYKHSVWAALKSDRGRLPDKDVQILLDNLRDAIKFCNDVSTSADNIDEMLQNATLFYGGSDETIPFTAIPNLKVLEICKLLEHILAEERCIEIHDNNVIVAYFTRALVPLSLYLYDLCSRCLICMVIILNQFASFMKLY